ALDVEATDLGEFSSDGRLRLLFEGHEVMSLSMKFLHGGIPRPRRTAAVRKPDLRPFLAPEEPDLGPRLEAVLASLDVCSKESIIRQYDHEVQGGSALKPLVGARMDGPGDACVVVPLESERRGFAVGNGINPHYGDLDPAAMAGLAI